MRSEVQEDDFRGPVRTMFVYEDANADALQIGALDELLDLVFASAEVDLVPVFGAQ